MKVVKIGTEYQVEMYSTVNYTCNSDCYGCTLNDKCFR